jgi:hypothetical protein
MRPPAICRKTSTITGILIVDAAGVDAGGHAGGQIFDRDAYATGSVHGG